MAEKKKLSLDELKVESFVTQLKAEEQETVMGGFLDIPGIDVATINDSCFSWCSGACNDYPSGRCPC